LPAATDAANLYFDVLGGVIDAGDAHEQAGGGAILGFDIGPSLYGITRFQYTFRSSTYELAGERDAFYSHMTAAAGIQYITTFNWLRYLRLMWQTSVLAGYSSTAVELKGIGEESDDGMTIQAFTGLRYMFNQHVAPYIEAGWSHSFYSGDLSENDIYGVQVFLGCRFSLNSMKNLGDEY
jgi:hypothetical protein